jgi:ribosomal protein L10
MNYLKKQINLKKTINFFSEYKIILSFQYSNLTVKEWCDFKLKLQKLKKIGILFTKNTLMKKVQESTKLTNTIKYNNKFNEEIFFSRTKCYYRM